MLGLCFVLIMVALDQTVIGTALPTIVALLGGTLPLTSEIVVPLAGWLPTLPKPSKS